MSQPSPSPTPSFPPPFPEQWMEVARRLAARSGRMVRSACSVLGSFLGGFLARHVSGRAFFWALLPAAAGMFLTQCTMTPLSAVTAAREQVLLAEARDSRLAATVTALAQALGELAATQPDENARRELLVRAVDPVRTGAAHWDYVFLSQGTVNVHTPTLPDAGGVDFDAATDVHGMRFVRRMMDTARAGGGFTEWTADVGDGRAEARRAYTLAVPGTDYWLGAWAPTSVQPPATAQSGSPTPRALEFHALRLGWLAALGLALLVGILARRRETARP
ncbi:cache domain-containing protein [Nitratidesulfovibrio sp. 1201_IL3209]|uniref:cache domain-containing protein n=1 Tax=Nitratidesulfovibrio sp. 1201_IL3209 TaxID=3084053 RepID=UPI002FDAD60A